MSSRTAHHAGFTLAEVLAAMSIIAVALLATTAALQYGLSGIEIGRGESSAVLLIEHKLEELKAVALVDWTDAALEPGTTTEYCRPSTGGCSATPTPAAFRRTTTVTAGSGGHCAAQCKFVMVSVFYRPVSVLGQLNEERRVDVGAVFVSRT
jgi:prepilin-type N-terminal cleavage/methylation domain-containing protein